MTPAPDTLNRRKIAATVFIIDDDDSVRTAMRRLLRSAGYDTATFGDVDSFLELSELPFDCCVVTDVRMPGTSSIQLPALLKQRGVDVPVIFITAFDTHESRTEARLAGGTAYFRKPIDERALLDAIEWALGGSYGTKVQ